MSTLQTTFLKEKSFENYSNEAALEFLLSTAGVRGNIPAIISSMLDAFGSFKGILEARPAQLMSIPVLGVVENYSYLVCPDCGKKISVFGASHIEETAQQLGLSVAGRMPIDPELAQAADEGRFAEVQNSYLREAEAILRSLENREQ